MTWEAGPQQSGSQLCAVQFFHPLKGDQPLGAVPLASFRDQFSDFANQVFTVVGMVFRVFGFWFCFCGSVGGPLGATPTGKQPLVAETDRARPPG